MVACECLVDRRCGVATATHGGLTSAAPAACAFVHRKSRNSAGGRTRPNKSGGRKPPVVARLCIAKVAIASAGERRLNKSGGGVSPPWGTIIALAGECVFRRSTHAVRSGGREPPVANLATHLQGRCAIAREWRCAEGTRAAGVSKRRMASREWFLGLANGCSPFIIRYAPFAIGDSPTTQRFSHQLARRISGLLLGGGICGC